VSLKIVIPGADFSGLGNPKVKDYIEGLPAAGLSALYLFDEGPSGRDFSGPAQDRSGNGRHAPLWTGSVARKTAGGVSNVASPSDERNRGFGILTPVGITRKFTVFGVTRNLFAATPPPASNVYMSPWLSSGDVASPSSPSLVSGNVGTVAAVDGVLNLNQQNVTGGTADYPEIGIFTSTPDGSGGTRGWGGEGPGRPFVQTTGPKDSWIAWVLLFDADAGEVFLHGFGSQVGFSGAQVPAQLWADGQIALGGKHCFGVLPYGSTTSVLVKGEIAMGGIYPDIAKTPAEADELIAAMKARLAPQLGTIL